MKLTILDDTAQGTPEWHAARRGIVTASVVGKLLTQTLKVADNETARGVIGTLVAERITGETEPSFMNDDMIRGVMHEPIARDKYAETNGVTVEQVGFMVRDFGGSRLGASPDGLVGDDGGIEIKCPRAKTHIATIVADRVPPQYMAQIQACLLVSGRDWWDYVSFRAGLPMFTKRVIADPTWHAAIVEAVAAFEQSAEALIHNYLTSSEALPPTEPVDDSNLGLVF